MVQSDMKTGLRLRNEEPGFFEKALARVIGLEEAIIIQQIHYWCQHNRKRHQNYYEGHYWVYNSIREWQQQFDFWSYDTVRNVLRRLIKQGYLITGNFNKRKADRTKWYRINEKAFDDFDDSPLVKLAPVDRQGKAKGYHEGDKFVKFVEPVEVG